VYFRKKGKARNRHFGLLEITFGTRPESRCNNCIVARPLALGKGWVMFLVCMTCRFCHICFCVCRSCYRRQAYCGGRCRKAARLCSHRQAQRRYRQTAKGKRAHCLSENRRRYGKHRTGSKNMADQTTKSHGVHCKKMPVKHANGVSFQPGGRGYCHFCSRWGIVLSKFPRRNYGNRVYDPFASRR
jgi:hypothetical protein